MVNLGKRMRRLKPLLAIRSGQGAAILPALSRSSSQPRLTHIHLRFPSGPFVHGARLFWRNHLRRLKYHNPALPISIEQGPGDLGSPMALNLTFEGTDVEALKAVAKVRENLGERSEKKSRLAQMRELAKEGFLTEEEKEKLARTQSPNWRDAPRDGMISEEEEEELEREAEAADMETLADLSGQRTVDDGEVVLKEPQPEASADTGDQPPAPMYTLSVTLGVKDRTASQIWNWFKTRTNCTEVPRSVEDEKEYKELAGVFSQSAMDRRRVKKGVDERKANDEMLRRARGEVEKLKAEA